ncbi:MAG: bifunctional methylenetetrahydrofolate dehydrogenase/methenyltetrahydrofolate cyclohydrolase FolD [Planctomycetes bacterium]|nr:bifunctional methylenetetrahydrofolate dehydrogenase/methenyltetrahydrofolate cyclohydrolase FolD [Planctomycetota bacterium]MCB9909207.1 bifunctional methylenetetrahydrofolate dehydrogenase/methenyltetrahydrofolate cyclohydrolase FolD [Planctomycetota bacterium]MCB9913311.1 bifunctional methylenetetrahydrofolate dehydrogenase/methenyltetrahydrofolate cyclohydrolase FolD [Planctomycetota bacterium]HPF13233.1 bifunctional methylenetetrahydrofolate dehydrogenase/methenyltetrahydrofolate cyclohy
MSEARILDGKATALAIRTEVRSAAAKLEESGCRAGLAVVLVGEDPASHVYVRNKDRAASDAGLAVQTVRLGAATTQERLLQEVRTLAEDDAVHGILVQLPLPSHLDAAEVIEAIPPHKDVDGLTQSNVAALVTGRPGLRPCTPAGCIELLTRYEIGLEGKHVVVVGRSMLVGKPLAHLALAANATVTICHSRTQELEQHCRRADILVAAVGIPELIRGDWVQPGAVVLDVGINRAEDGRLVGDVDFEGASRIASAITPVPGGIGPMTIAMLLVNTLQSAALRCGMTAKDLGWGR